MARVNRLSREEYLALEYPLNVIADLDGGYVIEYPDLPGCMGQVETLEEVGAEAEEICKLWIEAAYDQGLEIPLPAHREEYSGKFNVRLPKSLHRDLVAAAEREGVSLNQYVTMLLARGNARRQVEYRLDDLDGSLLVTASEGSITCGARRHRRHWLIADGWPLMARPLSLQWILPRLDLAAGDALVLAARGAQYQGPSPPRPALPVLRHRTSRCRRHDRPRRLPPAALEPLFVGAPLAAPGPGPLGWLLDRARQAAPLQ